tara:strand:+ start:8839 stop:10422 length:1584 start_codon:yes stop_codon:yes gene_type:complete
MDKMIKINSKQGSFDAGTGSNKKLCDFTLPRGNVYNLNDSYINVNLQIDSTDVNETPDSSPPVEFSGGRGIQILDLSLYDNTLASSTTILPNVALVKNANMRSQKLGRIDDVRRCDHLKSMLYGYEKDTNDKIDASYYSLSGTKQGNNWRNSPFQRLEKEGSNNSLSVPHDVRIKLGEIFDICNEEQVDCNRLGDVDIHLELNLDKLRVNQQLGGTTATGARDAVWTETRDGQTHANNQMDDSAVATGATDLTFLITKATFRPDDFKTTSPFHLGQKLLITGEVGAGATQAPWTPSPNRERTITQIDYDNTTGKLKLTLDSSLISLTNGQNASSLSVKGTNVASTSIVVNKIEMVVKVVMNPTNVPNQLTYYTYKTEEDNLNNRIVVNKNYSVQGDCENVYIGFGGDLVETTAIQGTANSADISSYRFQLNNVDVVNRSIQPHLAIHNDLIRKTYLNNQRKLKAIGHTGMSLEKENGNNITLSSAIMTPLIERDDLEQSILGLELNCVTAGRGINDIKIFQEVIKTI